MSALLSFPSIVLATLLLMTACSAPRSPEPPILNAPASDAAGPEAPYPPTRSPRVGDILHLPTGLFVTQEQMLRTATDARVVYVGETHDNPASHRQELALLRAFNKRHPGRIALGMEMFTPAQQDVLDRWSAGELSEKDFLRDSRWYDVWRMDFDYYRDLLLYARDHRIPVIGLNAEKSLVSAVRGNDAAELPEMDRSDPYHRAMVEAIFGGHAHGGMDPEAFLRVQTLWDEKMAEGVARFLEGNPEHRMLVVAGGNHVRYGFGIPRRAFRRIPHSYALVGSREIEIPPEKQDMIMDVKLPSFPMIPYHFLAYTRYESLETERVRMGVMLGEEEGAVVVRGIVPGSAAERAGVETGDRIVRLDGQAVEDSFDVIYAVRQKEVGDRIVLSLANDQEVREVEIRFDGDLTDSAP